MRKRKNNDGKKFNMLVGVVMASQLEYDETQELISFVRTLEERKQKMPERQEHKRRYNMRLEYFY